MSGEAERAFLEFRAEGRPRAMARVFDPTAQELSRPRVLRVRARE